MDKSGAKFKFVGHSTEIIRQSKNKGTLMCTSTETEFSVERIIKMAFESLYFQQAP